MSRLFPFAALLLVAGACSDPNYAGTYHATYAAAYAAEGGGAAPNGSGESIVVLSKVANDMIEMHWQATGPSRFGDLTFQLDGTSGKLFGASQGCLSEAMADGNVLSSCCDAELEGGCALSLTEGTFALHVAGQYYLGITPALPDKVGTFVGDWNGTRN